MGVRRLQVYNRVVAWRLWVHGSWQYPCTYECMGVLVCYCIGTWVYGCVGVQVCGYICVGCMGAWVYIIGV